MRAQTIQGNPSLGGGVSNPVLLGEYCCYRCQSLLVIAGSTLGTVAKTVEWFSAMVAMDDVCLYNI